MRGKDGRRRGGDIATLGAGGVVALAALAIAAPAVTSGGTGHRPVSGHQTVSAPRSASSHTSDGGTGASTAHAPRRTARQAQTPYVPPLHGTNPHGQGTIGLLDTAPSNQRPLPGDPTGEQSNEEIVVARARGEQRADGSYHGHITVLALFGNEIVGLDTNEGQEDQLNPLQREVLDRLCNAPDSQACVRVVSAHSRTGDKFSDNLIEIASARLGSGTESLNVGAGTARGTIAETSVVLTGENSPLIKPPLPEFITETSCASGVGQIAYGQSQVANVTGGGNVVADLVTAISNTLACPRAPAVVNVQGRVIGLGQSGGVPLPAEGCGEGTPNATFEVPTLLTIVCNATDIKEGVQSNVDDDGNTVDQAADPYGVREALTLLLLNSATGSQVKLTASAAESLARVPAQPAGPQPPAEDGAQPPAADDDAGTRGAGERDDDAAVEGAGRREALPAARAGAPAPLDGARDAGPADDSEADGLPFTGGNVGGMAVGGLLLLMTGLVLRRRLRPLGRNR